MGGLSINFQDISLEQKALFDKCFSQRRYENAHYNFTNLYMWRNLYSIKWAEVDGYLVIKAGRGEKQFMLQPFGPDAGIERILAEMAGYCTENNQVFKLSGIEKFMIDILEKWRPGKFAITADRDNYDYVYNSKDLIELKGRKYHSKKNHVNSFLRNYSNYQYIALTSEWVPRCVETQLEWCRKKGCDDDAMLKGERDAIIEVLIHWNELKLTGGLIYIDEKVEAFSFGEQLNSDTAVIHVEKANPDIRGVYPVINQQFSANAWRKLSYINREEDMGLEGLRKAKESYCPVKMVEKFIAILK
nr:phosphatidylglycerol lysyltransferase domain-containing protein [Sporomusa silvacetica]